MFNYFKDNLLEYRDSVRRKALLAKKFPYQQFKRPLRLAAPYVQHRQTLLACLQEPELREQKVHHPKYFYLTTSCRIVNYKY